MEPIGPPSWKDLPAGVLEIVFSKIDSEDTGPLRLVNSSWGNALNRSLKSLTIKKTHFDLDIESLGRRFTRLEKLTIPSRDKDILQKLSSIRSLTSLNLDWRPRDRSWGSNGLELLTNLSKLKLVARNNNVESNFMEMLSTLPNLKHLRIYGPLLERDTSLKQQLIEQLPGMTNLTRLDLSDFRFAKVDFLSGLTNLEALHVFHWVSGRNVNCSPLSSLVNLTRLDLSSYGVGSSVVNLLTNLKHLNLAANSLKNVDLATLTGLSKLTHLDLSGNRVTDEGVRFLTGLVSLKRLFLGWTRAKTAIQILAPLTGLEVLYLEKTPTKGTDLVGLSNLVGLKEVSVHRCKIERGELERVSAALPHIKFIPYFKGSLVAT